MKKTAMQKNARAPQKKFKCPQCGKSFQSAQGLSGHVRYLHPKPKRAASVPPPLAKQKAKIDAPALVSSTGAREHLEAAFAVLSQRVQETQAEISRLVALKAEEEMIRRELEAVKVTLQVFGERELVAEYKGETKGAKESTAPGTQEAAGAGEDLSQGEQRELSADAVPESIADDRNRQRPVAGRAKSGRNGQSERANRRDAPEFTGNKTEFVRAIIRSRGSAGAAPKDIDQVFMERGIERSKNVIYNALHSLVRQKKLKKKDGNYFYMESAGE
jgi:hypothetical protein